MSKQTEGKFEQLKLYDVVFFVQGLCVIYRVGAFTKAAALFQATLDLLASAHEEFDVIRIDDAKNDLPF